MKQDKKKSSALPMPMVMTIAIILSLIILFAAPSVLARYRSVAQGVAASRIAAFDIDVVEIGGFGDMIYFHKADNPENGHEFFIEAVNNSETVVRVRLRFFNVLQNNGNVITNDFQWWNNEHRRMVPAVAGMFNDGTPPTSNTTLDNPHPRIGGIRTADTAGQFFVQSDRQFYAATDLGLAHIFEGAIMRPGEAIRFYFNILPEINGPNNINNIKNHDDFSGNALFNAVFRINFDLVATQIH